MGRITRLFQTERIITSLRAVWAVAIGVAIVAVFSAATTPSGTAPYRLQVVDDESEGLRLKQKVCCEVGCDGGKQPCMDLEAEAEGEFSVGVVTIKLKGGATVYCREPEPGEGGEGGTPN